MHCRSRKQKGKNKPMTMFHMVWKSIPGIRDLTKIQRGNRENNKYFDGIRDLTAPREAGLAKIWAWDARFFNLFDGNSGNRHDPNKCSSWPNPLAVVSFQTKLTIECA